MVFYADMAFPLQEMMTREQICNVMFPTAFLLMPNRTGTGRRGRSCA